MKEQLEKIYDSAIAEIEKVSSMNDVALVRDNYLSRKGQLNEIKKGLKDLSDEDKKIVGSLANQISQKLEEALRAKHEEFYKKELDLSFDFQPCRYFADARHRYFEYG